MIAMQYDQTTLFAAKLKAMFAAPGMAQPLKQAIAALPAADQAKAREALGRLMTFDGKLAPASADAALYELFLQESTKQIFLDELGPESSASWKAFIANGGLSYSAQADHLLGREDSPFWDDIRTPHKEDKPTILARSLAAAISAGDSLMGSDHKAWQWGKLHYYLWRNADGQTVRGPVAAGGGVRVGDDRLGLPVQRQADGLLGELAVLATDRAGHDLIAFQDLVAERAARGKWMGRSAEPGRSARPHKPHDARQ